jgi:hypothetical protein
MMRKKEFQCIPNWHTCPFPHFSYTFSGGNSLFPVGGGAKPSKFPTKPSNFRQTPHLHSKRLFLAKIDYNHDALVRRKTQCPKILLFILVDVS